MDKKKRTIAKRVLSYVLVCALVLTASVLPQTVEKVYAQEEQTEEEYLYIPLYTTGKVAKVKISNGTSGEIDVGKNPNSATMDAYGHLYVSNREGKTISVIDMDKFEIVDTISIGKMVYGVTFDPTFENLYIGTSNGIDVYNIKEKTKTTILSGSIFLCSVTKEKVYAVRYNTTKLYIYDIMNQNTTEVDTGTSPKYIGNISPDEKKYVINGTSTRTQIIDLEDNNKKLGEINVFAYYADFSSDSKYLYLMDTSNKFHKYNADTLTEIASVNVGTTTNWTFGISKDGNTAYILSYSDSKVVVVDISTDDSMSVKKTISLSGMPYVAGGFMPTSYVWKNIIEENTSQHSHTWAYAAEGNTVKAYCTNAEGADDNCTYQGTEHAVTLTLTANDTEYSNNAYTGASVTADGISSVTGATVGDITYYLSDGSTQTNADNSGAEGTGKAPKYAGNYVAKVTVTDSEDVSKTATASDTFEIKKGTYSGTKTVSGNILAGCASSDVEVTLPAIPEHMVCGVPSYSAPITSATVENGKVKYSADNTAEASKDYTITVPVTEKTGETANYSDYNITITLTGIECSHSSTTPVAAVEATCMTDGMKAYDLCSVCGSKLVDGAIRTDEELKIPKTGHTLTYTANEATLSATCSKDNNHKAALTLTAASPTYSGDGVTTGWNEGEKVAFTLAGEEDWKAVLGADSIPAIQYYLENGSVTTSENSGAAGEGQAPVKVGKYVAKIAGSDVTASKAFEIKASNTQGGGGNSTPSIPSGGDNKPSTPAEDYTIPVKSENTVEVKAEIKEGTAEVSEITEETINKVTDAKGESKVDTIKIDFSGAKQEVTGVTISKQSVEALAKATNDNTNGIDTVTIELSKATVVLDTKTLETLIEDAKGTNIRLVVDDKEHKELNASQQTAVKDYHVATSFEAYFESEGARIHDFKGGKATVSIDFTPEAGKSIDHYHMVYLPDEGGMTRFKTKYENGQLVFTTTHFSDYAVIYDENEKNETGNEEEKPVEQKPAETQVAANTIAINKGLKVSPTGTKINVSWGKVADADGYLVYAAYCGTDFGKAVKTIKDPSSVSTTITKMNGKKLDLKKHFKVYVKAYKLVDGKMVTFGKSISAHIVGVKNTKNTNVKEIKLTSKSKLALTVGKTSKIQAKVVLVDAAKKQLSDAHAAQFRYASSDKKVAMVDKKGKITAKAKGTCYIYVYAKNGYAKKVTVTVK